VYTATLYGVAEEVKPILAPWKIQNFTAAEALHVLSHSCFCINDFSPVIFPSTQGMGKSQQEES